MRKAPEAVRKGAAMAEARIFLDSVPSRKPASSHTLVHSRTHRKMALTTYLWKHVGEASGRIQNNYWLIIGVFFYALLAVVLTPIFIIVDIITCCRIKAGPF